MRKPLRLLLVILLWLILLGGGFVFYWIQDPNRFKPELEELLETRTGARVELGGNLSWRLWPTVSLTAEAVSADYQERSWYAARISADLVITSLLRDPQRWIVESLTVHHGQMREGDDLLELEEMTVRDLTPGQPAPVQARLVYSPAGEVPLPLDLNGKLTFDPLGNRVRAADTHFETAIATGTCNMEVTFRPDLPPPPSEPPSSGLEPTPVLPLELFRNYDWDGTCTVDRLTLREATFSQLTAKLSNRKALSTLQLRSPDFFDGRADLDATIDASAEPVRWTLVPDLQGVNSQRLLDWLGEDLNWLAPLAYGGTLRLEGNTEAELLASLSGETEFDGGQGTIDIRPVKQQVARLAAMLKEGDRISAWPDDWDYQHFTGDWRIDRQHHQLDLRLDNLTVAAEGDYQPSTEQIDLSAELTFGNDPTYPIFEVDPLLYGLPIPVHCKGPISEPACRLDERSAQRIVASALQSDAPDGLRSKLERKIEDEVPAEYQDAARSLLELFSRSLQTESAGR